MRPVRSLLAWLLLTTTLPSLPASASTTAPGRQVWDSEDDLPSTAVTEAVKCTVIEVLPERMLVVEDEHGRRHALAIPEQAKIKAQSKKEFDGRKELEFGQLQPGHKLKVTFLAENGVIVRVQVLKQA